MARFSGKVGYAVTVETAPDVWMPVFTERDYYGTILNDTVAHGGTDKVNEDPTLSSRISIVADPYALGNWSDIKYVVDEVGAFWEVTSVQIKRPRLILSTGGVYDGPKPQSSP